MIRGRTNQLSILSFVLAALPLSVAAHHSRAEFDENVLEEIEGEIVAAYWRNPHVNFTLETVNADGEEETYELEAFAWASLSRQGVAPDAVKIGDQVTVSVHRSTRRPRQLWALSMVLADGTDLNLRGGGQATTREPRIERTLEEPVGLFRVWVVAGGRRVPLDGNLPLTPRAVAQHAEFDPITDDPLLQCIAPGMPTTMGNPFPMQFLEADGNITLHLEEFDNFRTIHIDGDSPEADHPHSPLGYSVGHWEGGMLVVRTTHIDYPYFNRVGVAQSEGVETLERFTLSEDGTRLDYELEIVDTETFTEPVAWSTHYRWDPSEQVRPYECTVERYVPI